MSKTVAIASDHGGFALKQVLAEFLRAQGHKVLDLGTGSAEVSVDYPDFAAKMAVLFREQKPDYGVLLCGTGIGISIAANRFPELRCALCHDATTARLARQHNDANILALGGRVVGTEVAKDCLNIFLDTAFEGGRHAARVTKLRDMTS